MNKGPSVRRAVHRRGPGRDAPSAAAGVRLERWHRRALYATLGVLAGSGALWLLFHYFIRVPTEWGEGPHPLETWWLRLHGLAAMLTLIAVGTLLLTHVGPAWQRGRNRASGAALAAALVLLIGTGYALYYFGGEDSRPAISLIHWLFGFAAAVLVVAHVVLGRGISRERHRPRQRSSPARRPATQATDEGRLHSAAIALDADPVRRPPGAAPGGRDH